MPSAPSANNAFKQCVHLSSQSLNVLHETHAERRQKPASSGKRVRDRACTGLSYPEAASRSRSGMGCLSLRKWLFFPHKPMSTDVHPCPPMSSLLFPQDITCAFPQGTLVDMVDIGGHWWTWVDIGGHCWTLVDMGGHVGGHGWTWVDIGGHGGYGWTFLDMGLLLVSSNKL